MRKIFSIKIILFILFFVSACNSINNNASPLKGITILVTTPSNYASRFARLIEKTGANAILFPTVETIINPNTSDIDSILQYSESIDWVILPSRKAMDAYFSRFIQDSISLHKLSKIKYCAIGNDINYLKDKYKISTNIELKEAGPNGIVEALSKEPFIKGQNIVVVAPLVLGVHEPNIIPNLIRDIRNLNTNVTKAEAYITQLSDSLKYLAEIELLKRGEIDIIAFTSTSEIEALIKLTSIDIIDKQIVACFGPYTGNNAKKLGLHPEYIGDKYNSFDDFVTGISNYILEQKKEMN